ncbi:MAG TPA: cupin domain-containing protein [Thermoplasmata archaeon]|nr:cupin domain-containing protein [Thermoplasmata archaeon]
MAVGPIALDRLITAARGGGVHYREFLRATALSAGLYFLPAGSDDRQVPHREDELYLVLRGRARFRLGADDREVGPNDLIYVAAGAEHRFHSVLEELVLLVVFAPPETPAP